MTAACSVGGCSAWVRRFVVATLIVTAGACGGDADGPNDTNEPRMPARGEPAFGVVGNILVSDNGVSEDLSVDAIWVGVDRSAEWNDLVMLTSSGADRRLFVGGTVIVDATQPLGFRLDPATTAVGEVVAQGIATTLDRIKANPQAFADNQPFGRWAFRAEIKRVVPSD